MLPLVPAENPTVRSGPGAAAEVVSAFLRWLFRRGPTANHPVAVFVGKEQARRPGARSDVFLARPAPSLVRIRQPNLSQGTPISAFGADFSTSFWQAVRERLWGKC